MKKFTLLLLFGLIAYLLYAPGLSGIFVFDDHPNILQNAALKLDQLNAENLKAAAWSMTSGPLQRPVALLSFALNYYFAQGFDYPAFALTNILIHGLSGWLLMLGCLSLLRLKAFAPTQAMLLSAMVGLLWLIAPLQLTSVLYIVQRMTSLSGLFIWASIWAYLEFRLSLTQAKPRYGYLGLSLLLFWPLALFSKENAVLLPLLLWTLEFFILDFQAAKPQQRQSLIRLYQLGVGLPAILATIYLLWKPGFVLNGYLHRDFGLTERLLTQANGLWLYVQQLLLPTAKLFALFHDEPHATNLLNPVHTLFAVIGWLLVLVLILLKRKQWPWLCFGFAFFLSAHVLESSIFGLELLHEHRNYVASGGLLLGLVMHLQSRLRPQLLYSLLILWAVYSASQTWFRAELWGKPLERAEREVLYHPDSARSQYTLAQMLFETALSLDARFRPELFTQVEAHAQQAFDLKHSQLDAGLLLVNLHSRLNTENLPVIWPRLIERIRQTPLANVQTNALQGLSQCVLKNTCSIPALWVQNLLATALTNPSLERRPDLTANLHTELAMLSGLQEQTEQALYHAKQAKILMPNEIQNRLNYLEAIRILKPDEWQSTLDAIQKDFPKNPKVEAYLNQLTP